MPHYIPQSDPSFDKWQKHFMEYLGVHVDHLGITTEELNEAKDAQTGWHDGYTVHTNTQNAAMGATQEKDEAQDAFVTVIRQLTRKIQARKETTDKDRKGLGITVPDRTPTPLSDQIVLTEQPPRIDVACEAPKQARIDWYCTPVGTEREALPQGIDGVAIWYAEGGIPAEKSAWRFLALDTKSPYIHNVGNNETLTIAYKVQWFDRRKRFGPFCDPVTVAVTA